MKLSDLEPGDAYSMRDGLVAMVVGKRWRSAPHPMLTVLWSDGMVTQESIVDFDLDAFEVFLLDEARL